MLAKVTRGTADFNNSATISKSPFLTNAKLAYYRAFAMLYGFVGSFADAIMVCLDGGKLQLNERKTIKWFLGFAGQFDVDSKPHCSHLEGP